jgi:hypothetical protein
MKNSNLTFKKIAQFVIVYIILYFTIDFLSYVITNKIIYKLLNDDVLSITIFNRPIRCVFSIFSYLFLSYICYLVFIRWKRNNHLFLATLIILILKLLLTLSACIILYR